MKRTLAFLMLITAWSRSEVLAQSNAGPTTIILRPAAEPSPALKYRLVPERRSLIRGNAALFYHRANRFFAEKQVQIDSKENGAQRTPGTSVEELISGWINGPIAEIPRDVARAKLAPFENALKEVELGATRTYCDWEFDQRTEGINLLLPEIQAVRSLARLVALRVRLAILDGKTDEAMHWIEVGLVLGRHVSEGPSVIQSLVGIAIGQIMELCLEDLIQVPGTPSLFWALADRPRPFIDMRDALEGERYMLEKMLPELNELENGIWSLDRAQKFSDDLQRKLFALVAGEPISGTEGAVPLDMPNAGRQLAVGAIALKIYPQARKALLAAGRTEADVDAMPVIQVCLLHTVQEYRRYRDNTYKWFNIPYWQVPQHRDRMAELRLEANQGNMFLSLFRVLDPALESARWAGIRIDRKLDALQCIESIRLYAAAHDGKLPPSLDVLTDSPVPLDQATGKPFEYKVDGDTATLSGPGPNGAKHWSFTVHYVLKLAK